MNEIFDVAKESLVSRAEACKKIKTQSGEIQKCLNSIFDYLEYFNSLTEFEVHVFTENWGFDDVNVPNEFKDLIIPRTMRFNPALRQCLDVLIKTEVKDASKFSMTDWTDLITKWRSFFKKDSNVDVTSLANIKNDQTLFDVVSKLAIRIDGKLYCRYEGSPFVPIEVEADALLHIFRDDYWNALAQDVVTDLFSITLL